MIAMRTNVLAIAALLCVVARPITGQAPTAVQHPIFAGTWAPSDPARSDKLFSVGLTPIPGGGRLKIEQTADRLTVTITVPDDKLKIWLALTDGPFYPTMVYHLTGSDGRSGGVGAGGPPPLPGPTWVGDRLVIPNARALPPRFKGITATYSLDGDQLKLENRWDLVDGRANDVTEWFKMVK
jgi:hypothetical protein